MLRWRRYTNGQRFIYELRAGDACMELPAPELDTTFKRGPILGTVQPHVTTWVGFAVGGKYGAMRFHLAAATAREARVAVYKQVRAWQEACARWQLGEAAGLAFKGVP